MWHPAPSMTSLSSAGAVVAAIASTRTTTEVVIHRKDHYTSSNGSKHTTGRSWITADVAYWTGTSIVMTMAAMIAKMTRILEVQFKWQVLNGSDPINILSFMSAFCWRVALMESMRALWCGCSTSSWKRLLQSTSTHVSLKLVLARQDSKLTSCCQVVNYLLATFTNDDIFAETNMNIMNLNQSLRQSTVEFVEDILEKCLTL